MSATLLAAYLEREKLTDGEFAGRLGVPQSTVWRWVHGRRTPTIAWALRIRDETSGAVPIEGWALATRRGK